MPLARTQPRTRWYAAMYRRDARADRGATRRRVSQLRGSATPIGEQIGARTAGVSYAVQSLFVARERRELDGLVEVLDALADEHPHQPGFVTTAAWVRSRDRRCRRSTRTSSSDSVPTASHRFRATASGSRTCGCSPRSRTRSVTPARRLRSTSCCSRTAIASSSTSRVLTFLGSVEHALGLLALTHRRARPRPRITSAAHACSHVGARRAAAHGPDRHRARRAAARHGATPSAHGPCGPRLRGEGSADGWLDARGRRRRPTSAGARGVR